MKTSYLIILLLFASDCLAQTSQTLRQQELADARELYRESLNYNFNVLQNYLTETQRQYLANTRLEITLNDNVLYARAYGYPENKIQISAATILFLEELATTLAWYDDQGITDRTPIANYVLLVRRYRNEGRPTPSMTDLLDVPSDDIWDNPDYYRLKNFARGFLNSCTMWILAHEVGHKALGHVDQTLTGNNTGNQYKEIQADNFANQAINKLNLKPEAVVILMTYYSMLNRVRIEFPSNEAWANYLSNASHPVWPERMENIASFYRTSDEVDNRNAIQMDLISSFLQNYDILSALLVGSENLTEQNILEYNPFANIPSKYIPTIE